jgi:hypothetical protein
MGGATRKGNKHLSEADNERIKRSWVEADPTANGNARVKCKFCDGCPLVVNSTKQMMHLAVCHSLKQKTKGDGEEACELRAFLERLLCDGISHLSNLPNVVRRTGGFCTCVLFVPACQPACVYKDSLPSHSLPFSCLALPCLHAYIKMCCVCVCGPECVCV